MKNKTKGRLWKNIVSCLIVVSMLLMLPGMELYAADKETITSDSAISGELDISKVEGLSDDFIMGVDISSVMSEFESGVVFQDFEGNTIDNISDFCKFLKECGITHIRVRVWNDPYDENGNGYGGGNNDVDKAVQIAEGCAAAGIKMLVDFHYSDFWADPGKQQEPKAWKEYTLDEKKKEVEAFTTKSLQKISASGVDIDMVQIGNETTNQFVEEKGDDYADMCSLFNAGAKAVRAFDQNVKIVIHLTNPERTNQLINWAKRLADHQVDYDVLATSYYPYWHGTLDNLKSQFEEVRSKYGKDVMVAETSYAYTLEDSDGHDNTVRTGNNDTLTNYPFTPQGQVECIRDIIEAVHEAGGLGVYYWEPAWITVGDTTGLSGDVYDQQVAQNQEKWEQFGSGWASSYSAEYDPDDAGKWFGGSAVDNQAMFYPDGSPVASLHVWEYVKTGSVLEGVLVQDIEEPAEEISISGTYTLPDKINVQYNQGAVMELVQWNAEDIAAVDTSVAGIYEIHGTVTFSKEITAGNYQGAKEADVVYTLTVLAEEEENLIVDEADAGFEKGENFTVEGTGVKPIPSSEDVLEGNGTLHWYGASQGISTVTYQIPTELESGIYTLDAAAMGQIGDTVTLQILNEQGEVLFTGTPTEMAGWTLNLEECQTPSVNFELKETTTVKLQIVLNITAGGWGSLDCLNLHRHEKYTYQDLGNGIHQIRCASCGMILKEESCTMTLQSVRDKNEESPAELLYECICGAQNVQQISVEIQNFPQGLNLDAGKTYPLKLEVSYGSEAAGVDFQMTYESSDSGIVSVDESGVIKAEKAGTADVICSVMGTVFADGQQVSFLVAKNCMQVQVTEQHNVENDSDHGKNQEASKIPTTEVKGSSGAVVTGDFLDLTGVMIPLIGSFVLVVGIIGVMVFRKRKSGRNEI